MTRYMGHQCPEREITEVGTLGEMIPFPRLMNRLTP